MLTTPQRQTLTLAANQDLPVPLQGRYLEIVSCTQATIGIGFDSDQPQIFESGKCYPGPKDGFGSIRFLDTSGLGCTVVYRVADFQILGIEPTGLAAILLQLQAINLDTDNLANIKLDTANLATILGELQGLPAPTGWGRYATLAATAAVVMAANVNRRMCQFQADPENTDYVEIGYDNTVTNTKWALKLAPGQGYTIEVGRWAIWAYSPTINQYLGWTDA